MPLYQYRCPTCDARFEERRAMTEADGPAVCPDGHDGARRMLAVFATTARSPQAPTGSPPMSGCGAGCVCHPG